MTDIPNIPFGRPWVTDGERTAVQQVLEGHILTHGVKCEEFEDAFARFVGGDAYCLTVSSCMSALYLAYFQMGIGFGDEVIVPAQTHTATVHAVELVGAKPVFVDCNLQTGNMDCERIEAAITPDTKAIGLVHFLGIPCDMDHVLRVADQYQLKVIEDCALAVGACYEGKHVGLFGDVGCFSFYPVKHITTGEGGMFVTRHAGVAEQVSRLRAFGVDRSHSERTVPGKYDVTVLGINSRMSEIQAAIGCQQLTKINQILGLRADNFSQLKASLSGIRGISILDADHPNKLNSHYCLSVILHGDLKKYRDSVIRGLNEAGVGTSIYYPHPVPRLTYYKNKYGYQKELWDNAATISDCSIALPVAPHVTLSDIQYISDSFRKVIKEVL
ncbi:MAG: cell wall biogenesis protein [Planctomycetaceae bacterium]|nr:cell wall biogenesis protein [Planctomycetaceae bacterium]